MEDGAKVVAAGAVEVKPHSTDTSDALNKADSTSKLSPNELSPDSTSEIGNTLNKSEEMDNFVTSKVNGDCGIECTVPPTSFSPSSNNNSNNNHTMSTYKLTTDKNISYNIDKVESDTRCDSQKNESTSGCESEIGWTSSSNKENDITRNLSNLVQQKSEDTCESEEQVNNESLQSTSVKDSNVNEVSSTLEDKSICEMNDVTTSDSVKSEIKPAISKTRKSSVDLTTSSTSKVSDAFKPPHRYDLKSTTTKVKSSECFTASESSQNKGDIKLTEKIGRNSKRKAEEKVTNLCEGGESNDIEKFPIQYKGFKKKINGNFEKSEKRSNLKWNPFNPACKQNRKSNRCIPSRFPIGDEVDCTSLQQSEYAQYLGLQPILKFRCSNCGSSAFQSMVALNTHQIECTKPAKGKLDKSVTSFTNPVINEPKSTNIKLTRKVFLCSACGTYYEHWNLFLHMREVHRRYICLYCLGMFSIAERLSEHLLQKHKIANQNFTSLEEFQKHSYQTFFLLCVVCDKVFSEMDDFDSHICATNKKNIDNIDTSNKSELVSNQEGGLVQSASETCSNVNNNKANPKRTREASKRNSVNAKSQSKKEETSSVNSQESTAPTTTIATLDPKEDVKKTSEVSASKSLESQNSITETEQETIPINNETDSKNSSDQEVKVQESQDNNESVAPPAERTRPIRKAKALAKKTSAKKRKLGKEKDEDIEVSAAKLKKISDEECNKEFSTPVEKNAVEPEIPSPSIDVEDGAKVEDTIQEESSSEPVQESSTEAVSEAKEESVEVPEEEKSQLDAKEDVESPKEEPSASAAANGDNIIEPKSKLQANLLKFKLSGIESDGDSDDSQKLALVVDETPNSDNEQVKASISEDNLAESDSTANEVQQPSASTAETVDNQNSDKSGSGGVLPDVTLASEDVAVMALTLDDKIENIPIQTVLKECVRTSCMSCNYCRHAVKIAVNGKQLALHVLSEHRFMPVKNETADDVINKLKSSMELLETMYFNTETYDSTDPSIHLPYDQDSSFDCFQCNYVTASHRDLFAHKRKSHTKSLLLCIMCKSNFYSYSELLCHLCPGSYNAEIQFHNVDINFRCCFCRLDTIPSAFRLMVHLRKTHHTCDICLENGVDQQKLSTHMWKHKLNHLCYRCGIAYASKPDITKHLFWKHGHESVLCKKCLQKKWPHVYHFCIPPTSFICEECNTSFSKAVALKVHKRIHGNDFPYTCTECNKRFVSKKLLQRHEERHIAIKKNVDQQSNIVNNGEDEEEEEEEQKEENINVTDVINESKETTSVADLSDSKEVEHRDKSHKKHKKDKDKKEKPVVDVYDLPPLNLSSESDSSDEDNNASESASTALDNEANQTKEKEKIEKDLSIEPTTELEQSDNSKNQTSDDPKNVDNVISSPKLSPGREQAITSDNADMKPPENLEAQNDVETKVPADNHQTEKHQNMENVNAEEDSVANKDVEDIWKNFYNTNPQNSNLPYPLCALKSDIAIGIIMGDHDYCCPPAPIQVPDFSEDAPSTSGIPVPLLNDQLKEITEPPQERISELQSSKDVTVTSSPLSSPKKKAKSPKKRISKGDNENNSSSSSDSSSESSSSSCSCGPNCSCSSSSSNSSSSSSSDSESSGGEEGMKQDRKRRKRDRHNTSKLKSEPEPELPKEQVQQADEKTLSLEPVDPPIRESELETDESTTDEEFYDQQPQRIANQLLAEKRNQLMLLASAANANNGNSSPSPVVDIVQPEVVTAAPPPPPLPPKQKVRTKRKRKLTTKGKSNVEKNVTNSHPYPSYSKDNELVIKPMTPQYHANILPAAETKISSPYTPQIPVLAETPGSGSETEKSRSSKRRRIPNKFYGYSSGEEEEKPSPSPKWRRQDNTVNQPSRIQQPVHPPTPRVQLTVSKPVIRKPSYKIQKSTPKQSQPPPSQHVQPLPQQQQQQQHHHHLQQLPPAPPQLHQQQPSGSDSTDSGSEVDIQRPATHISAPSAVNPAVPDTSASSLTSQKNDKDVYCYCRCPYDEVSEMIACDDENCDIEWFHFECVGILIPPRGQWFCPGCRKARGLPT